MEFLSIGGNCADIHILGTNRVLGPVDNMKSKNGLYSISSIFKEDGLYNEFFVNGEIEQPFCGNQRDENEIWYSTNNYYVIHNNFRDKSFQESLKKRISTLYNYLNDLKYSNTKYLFYSLCEKDIDPVSKKMSNLFIKGYKILKEENILEKTLFVMVKSLDKKWYNYKCDDIYNYTSNVINIDINIENSDNYKLLIEQIKKLNLFSNIL